MKKKNKSNLFQVISSQNWNVDLQMAGVKQFELGEGIDNSGVITKILTCNCSLHLDIENKSKLFGLHIHPPTIDMSFGRVDFASSQVIKIQN